VSFWIDDLPARIDVAFGPGEELLIRQNPGIVVDVHREDGPAVGADETHERPFSDSHVD
jgi:hypothetical protein